MVIYVGITVRSYVLAIVYEWDLEMGNDSFPIELFQTLKRCNRKVVILIKTVVVHLLKWLL